MATHASSVVPRRGGRLLSSASAVAPIAILAVILGVLQGCASSSSANRATPTTQGGQRTCDVAETRYWARDDVAVSLLFSQPITLAAPSDQQILTAVASQIDAVLKQPGPTGVVVPATVVPETESKLPNVLRQQRSATVFFTLETDGTTMNKECDASLIASIDMINTTITSTKSGQQISFGGGLTATLAGASPDWLGTSDQGGFGDHVTGSPGNVATPAPSSVTINKPTAQPLTSVVYVLDTGYALSGGHSAPVACDGVAGCLPSSQPLTPAELQADLGGALPGGALASLLSDLLPNLQETDLALSDESLYEDFGTHAPVDVRDHGLFISEIIHHSAPGAQIRLIRVLDDDGVGDLRAFLFALQGIEFESQQFNLPKTNGGYPIVINASLDFGPPADCLAAIWHSWSLQVAGQPAIPCRTIGALTSLTPADAALYATVGVAVNDLVTSTPINAPQINFVAAAGNNSQGELHLDADMPAAFCGVIGAGAMPVAGPSSPFNSAILAPYSNLPYVQSLKIPSCLAVDQSNPSAPRIKLTALSDPTLPAHTLPITALGSNVCSLHLGPIGGVTPPAGLALWSGTSFATAFVSGYVAETGSIVNLGSSPTPTQIQPCTAP